MLETPPDRIARKCRIVLPSRKPLLLYRSRYLSIPDQRRRRIMIICRYSQYVHEINLVNFNANMSFLKKVLLSLALIILLAGIKPLFAKWFPGSGIFHQSFLSCLQAVILLWAVITGLAATLRRSRQPPAREWLHSTLIFLGFISLAEIVCVFLAHHPDRIPKRLLPVFSDYNELYQSDILQFDPDISCYDSTLFYRMKSNNSSVFRNVEFADSIVTDSLGFRDDNDALHSADIVCLGDSYTLGWGVGQLECWPQQLGAALHLPVLNTGMSSYGTVREIRSISRLPRRSPRLIIIQYCYNDLGENNTYISHGDSLPTSPRKVFSETSGYVKWSRQYFPGKTLFTLLKLSVHPLIAGDSTDSLSIREKHVPAFLQVLKHSGWNFDKVSVIVFDIGKYPQLSPYFSRSLQAALETPDIRRLFKGHVQALRIDSLLTPDDYYLLDAHIRASGHHKIAQALAGLIRSSGVIKE